MSSPLFGPPLINPFGLFDVGASAKPVFADLDGDGDFDLYVGRSDGLVRVLLNTGSANLPAFTNAGIATLGLINLGTFSAPTFVDIDGDGDLDAFQGNGVGNTIFYRNTGTATAPAFFKQTSAFGISDVGDYAAPAFADIDHDGDMDAFIGGKDGVTRFFRNQGTSTAPAFVLQTSNFGLTDVGNRAAPAFADFDQDGDLDAFIGNASGGITYFVNSGTNVAPAFSESTTTFGLVGGGGLNASPGFGDIDGDGDLDAFVGTQDGNTTFQLNGNPAPVTIAINGGVLTLTEGGANDFYTVVLNVQPISNVVIGLIQDGRVTALASSLTFTPQNWNIPQAVTVKAVNDTVYEGTHFGLIQHTVISADPQYGGKAAAPVSATITDNDLIPGEASFSPPLTNPFGITNVGYISHPEFADIDGDGDMDLFIGTYDGTTRFFLNAGTTSMPAFVLQTSNFGLADVGKSAAPAFVDIDADGDLDAFVGNAAGQIVFFRNTGTVSTPGFTSETGNFGLAFTDTYATPTFVDIDGDGDLDAVIGGYSGSTVFFRNSGTASAPNFGPTATNAFGLAQVASNATPSFADIDGDGDKDAFITGFFDEIILSRNTGGLNSPSFSTDTGTFGLAITGMRAVPTFVDINGDGDLDAFIGDNYGDLQFFENLRVNNTNPVLGFAATINYIDTVVDDAFAPITRSLKVTDVNLGDSLTFGILGGGDDGTTASFTSDFGVLTLLKATGVFTFLPNDAAIEALSSAASEDFIITVTDGMGTAQRFLTLSIAQSGVTETEGADVLTGTVGDDLFDGFGGDDIFNGLAGNDTVGFGSAAVGVTVSLATTQLQDTGVGSVTLNSIENLTGSAFDDVLISSSGNNILNGAGGADTASYAAATGAVSVSLLVAGAQDTVNAGADTLVNIENLTGSASNDTLTGDAQDNVLDGGAGVDILTGGDGSDTYVVDSLTDVVNETNPVAATGGFDWLFTSVSGLTLPTNVENGRILELGTLEAPFTLTGNALDNILISGDGDDVLDGGVGSDTADYRFAPDGVTVSLTANGAQDTLGAGSDLLLRIENLTGSDFDDNLTGTAAANRLDGGAGADVMNGGDGSDVYTVDDPGDVVIETNANATTGGTDWVLSKLAAYTLPSNVENGKIAGSGAASLTGNSLNNELVSGEGNNTLNGGAGTDTADYSTAAGAVTVNLGIGPQATGGSGTVTLVSIENLRGSAFDDVLGGNVDTNLLDGAAGVDTVTYATATGSVTVNLALTTAQNTVGAGTDTLRNFENLTGSRFDDLLTGSAGSNVLDGGVGADRMTGGDGADTYYVDNVGDLVVETNASLLIGGRDLVLSNLAAYTLPANVEDGRIVLAGLASLTGNSLDNVLFSGPGDKILNGGAGNDTANYSLSTSLVTVNLAITGPQTTGGGGMDTLLNLENLTGTAFSDTLTGDGGANILDGGAGADVLTGGDGSDIFYVDNIGDTLVETSGANSGTDWAYSYLATFLLPANIENGRILASGSADLQGNALNNVLVSGTGNNILDGGSGIDTADYRSASGFVTVSLAVLTAQATASSGLDTLLSIENLTGSGFNDQLAGNAGNNVIDGGNGTDTLTYAAASGRVTVDLALGGEQDTTNAGMDTLISIENLVGTALDDVLGGNASDNALSGGAGNDLLNGGAGNDLLNGGDGIDSLTGGFGADNLNGDDGNDVLNGDDGDDSLAGGGDVDSLFGGAGNDILDGGTGADQMSGGGGNDTYFIDDAGDVVTEASGTTAGIDTVVSSLANYKLLSNFENGRIDSAANLNLSGNSLKNALTGGAGNNVLFGAGGADTLKGGLGADTLKGGLGADFFDFNTLAESGITTTTRDTILDFTRSHGDRIDLVGIDANTAVAHNQAFSKVTSSATAFSATKTFTGAGQLYFDTKSHVLYGNVDADPAAEFSIKVLGIASLAKGDFLL